MSDAGECQSRLFGKSGTVSPPDGTTTRPGPIDGCVTLRKGLMGECVLQIAPGRMLAIHQETYILALETAEFLEFNIAKLNVAVKRRSTKRWACGNNFDDLGAKRFDFLDLAGHVVVSFESSQTRDGHLIEE